MNDYEKNILRGFDLFDIENMIFEYVKEYSTERVINSTIEAYTYLNNRWLKEKYDYLNDDNYFLASVDFYIDNELSNSVRLFNERFPKLHGYNIINIGESTGFSTLLLSHLYTRNQIFHLDNGGIHRKAFNKTLNEKLKYIKNVTTKNSDVHSIDDIRADSKNIVICNFSNFFERQEKPISFVKRMFSNFDLKSKVRLFWSTVQFDKKYTLGQYKEYEGVKCNLMNDCFNDFVLEYLEFTDYNGRNFSKKCAKTL